MSDPSDPAAHCNQISNEVLALLKRRSSPAEAVVILSIALVRVVVSQAHPGASDDEIAAGLERLFAAVEEQMRIERAADRS